MSTGNGHLGGLKTNGVPGRSRFLRFLFTSANLCGYGVWPLELSLQVAVLLRCVSRMCSVITALRIRIFQRAVFQQLTPRQAPIWLDRTGCEVAEPGKSFKYLGVATSSPVDERTITAEIVQKLMRKLKHWSNRLLSWPAKTILLKHVLAATPLYQLMSVGLCSDGLEELEKLCRSFLWGWNEEGNPKSALIAWERIAQAKGLGWVKLKDMADALYVRQINRILEGGQAEWIQLTMSFILRTLRKGAY
ncbi:hypothetical protein R1sor_009774 [Riccia sorocarpa]|uniref:Reverse transcriptase n=1 Tax=Riccia sorocarpa TaxID=122646 RepID=A0ABD3HW69_9MARC